MSGVGCSPLTLEQMKRAAAIMDANEYQPTELDRLLITACTSSGPELPASPKGRSPFLKFINQPITNGRHSAHSRQRS